MWYLYFINRGCKRDETFAVAFTNLPACKYETLHCVLHVEAILRWNLFMSFRFSLPLSFSRELFNRLQSFSFSKNNNTANCFINLPAGWAEKWAEYLYFLCTALTIFLFNFSSPTSIPFLSAFLSHLSFRFSMLIYSPHHRRSSRLHERAFYGTLFYGFPSQIASIQNRLIIKWVVRVRVAVAVETKRVFKRKQVIIYGRENILKAPRKSSIKLVTDLKPQGLNWFYYGK